MHASQSVEFRVGASVLIDQRMFMSKRKNSGNGPITFECQSDLQCFAKTVNQVSEPTARLRRNAVPTTRKLLQTIEPFKKRFGAACLLRQVFTFGAPDFS